MTTGAQELSDLGVSIWLDDLSRDRIASGDLAQLQLEAAPRQRFIVDDHRAQHRHQSVSSGTVMATVKPEGRAGPKVKVARPS